MQQEFIIKQGSANLIVFFAGWGMDANPFKDFILENHDLLICYDYRTLDFNHALLKGYNKINIIAWSMGVWVATQIEFSDEINIDQRIAINGTPNPIDDVLGIPLAIYNGTKEGLSEASLKKFQKRMCTNSDDYKYFQSVQPQRDIESLKDELIAIQNEYNRRGKKTLNWNLIYIGTEDRIFPFNNQKNGWSDYNDSSISIINEGHYSKELFISNLEKRWINS